MKRPIIIDCDPGHDDAIALVMALSKVSNLDVIGVTSTAGNQTIEKTTLNLRKILTFLDKDIPIGIGSEKPMFRDLEIAPSVHGKSGLDGPKLPSPKFNVVDSAWHLSHRLIMESKEPVTLVATGPLTNLGILLLAYPEVKSKIKEISIMGGGLNNGNWSIAAEFNILVDPEAANIVFKSGIKVIMSGLDVTEKARIMPEERELFRNSKSKVSIFIAQLLDFFSKFHDDMGFDGTPLHDPCAVAYLIEPEIFKTEDYHVVVETSGEYTKGMTIADKRINPNKEKANAKVVLDLDREKFIKLILKCSDSY